MNSLAIVERELPTLTSILMIVGAVLGAAGAVSIKMLDLWVTWDAGGKGLAVMLLLILVANPAVAIWRLVSGKRVRFHELFTSGYLAVILATILFARTSH